MQIVPAGDPNIPVGAMRFASYPEDRVRILQGLDWFGERRCHVINLSLGFYQAADSADPIAIAIARLTARGTVIVVAAGNRGPELGTLQEFAQHRDVISVAATNETGQLLESSSRGIPGRLGPTITTLGIDEHENPFPPGTSFASPRITRWVTVIIGAMSISRDDLVAVASRNWTDFSGPIPIPRLGFADTGVEAEVFDRQLRRAYDTGLTDDNVKLLRDSRAKTWYERLIETLREHRQICSMSVGVNLVRRALSGAAIPFGEAHETGAGFVDEGRIKAYLSNLTPAKWLAMVCPESVLPPDISAALDAECGPLFSPLQIDVFRETFQVRARPFVARVAK